MKLSVKEMKFRQPMRLAGRKPDYPPALALAHGSAARRRLPSPKVGIPLNHMRRNAVAQLLEVFLAA